MDISKITCEFGTIRTTQRKGRYAHRAIDAINYPVLLYGHRKMELLS
jgi:hypothetical protein